ncbi:MAG: mechanosensitive ion channel family protein [Blastocatellia bacterium]|nr:mechanosensitive ion channel family protein [Blastocatellia bacterium]
MFLILVQQTLEDISKQITEASTQVWKRLIGFIPEIGSAFLILVLTLLLARFVRRTISRAMATTKADQNIQSLVVRIGGIAVWLVGLAVTLSVLNVDAAALFAALGLTGAALGFAIRDIIANFIAGVVLLSTRPFKIGDLVTIETFEGIVEDLAIRATILKTVDGREVAIPNAKVFSAVVIKHSLQSSRRVIVNLPIDDSCSFEQVKDIVLNTLKNFEEITEDPAISISITSFSANVINLEVWFWVKPGFGLGIISTQTKLAIKAALDKEGIQLVPANTMTLFTKNEQIIK